MAIPLAGVLMPALAKVGAVKLPLLLRAAGVTPSILDAWDKFLGLIFVNFSTISVDKLGISP